MLTEQVALAIDETLAATSVSSVSIENQVAAGLSVMADAVAVGSVLRNLLDNALKATASAGGGHVKVTAQPHDGSVELQVSDDGVGFQADEASRLFQRF